MINILFFGRLRDELGLRKVELPSFEAAFTLEDVVNALAQRHGDAVKQALNEPSIVAAVDQQAQPDKQASISNAKEIAFFPPVTGG